MTQQTLLCAYVCVCVWERDRERDSWGEKKCVKIPLCVCVCECVHVCVCVKWCRREGEGVQMLEFDGQSTLRCSVAIISSPSSIPPENEKRTRSLIPPLNQHPPLPFLEAAHGCGCQISSTVRRDRALELWPETEKASTCLLKLLELFRQWRRRRPAFY